MVRSGDEGARTPDLNSAIVALSQLSYIPSEEDNNTLDQNCKAPFLAIFCHPFSLSESPPAGGHEGNNISFTNCL
jgi:hypothetical protein